MKNNCVMKKSIVSGMLSGVLIFMICFGVLMNPGTDSAEEIIHVNLVDLGQSIDQEIENDPLLGFSSNPYNYIQNNEYYDNIVDLGIEALPHLDHILQQSESNGLCEYMIVIAIEEISQANVKGILEEEYAWDNAKAFEKEWSEIKKTATQEIRETLAAPDTSEVRKRERLDQYGVLAVPAVEEAIHEGKAAAAFNSELQAWLNQFELSEHEKRILSSYVG